MRLPVPPARPDRILLCLLLLFFSSCILQKQTMPTGVFPKDVPKVPEPDAASAVVPPGYKVEVFLKDLIWPSSIEFDGAGNIYVSEAGFVYGDPFAPAQVLQITPQGGITRYATGFNGPITDILWHGGRLYVSHKGKISAVEADGRISDLVTGLPSHGDHYNNQMSVGPDGRIYFGQGTATNSGVVGLDNFYPYVWPLLWPDVYDVPAKDLRLRARSYVTPQPNNVLSRQGRLTNLLTNVAYAVTSVFNRNPQKSLLVKTRAFQPFGHHRRRVKGQTKAGGTILRMNPDGTGLEVYAWGLRNPYGVRWSADGILFVTDNGYDERGPRPIANAADNIWAIRQGAWYGFPDYSSGIPVTNRQFRPERGKKPKFLLKSHPAVEKPWLTRPINSAATKFDFSRSAGFGYKGHIFLAEFGSGTPITGAPNRSGYTVVRIDPATKDAQPFLTQPQGAGEGPGAGPRHPVEVRFSPDGETMYVVDIGYIGFELGGAGPFPHPAPGTGVIWRITRSGSSPAGPPANLSPMPPKTSPKR